MTKQLVNPGDQIRLAGAAAVTKGTWSYVAGGWDMNEGQSKDNFDCDVTTVARDADGNAIVIGGQYVMLYYGNAEGNQWGNPNPFDAWGKHSPDNRDGKGEGPDEWALLLQDTVPQEIVRLDHILVIYDGARTGQSFGMIENAFLRFGRGNNPQDESTGIVNANLTDNGDIFDDTGFFFGSSIRTGPTWSFRRVDMTQAKLKAIGASVATLDEFVASKITTEQLPAGTSV